jgi:hypothetical protein
MANVLDVFGSGDLYILQELADDLEEVLLSIGYGDEGYDPRYIEASKEYIEKKYGALIEPLADDVVTLPCVANSRLGEALAHVISAYYGMNISLFLNDLEDEDDRRNIRKKARDLVYEHLIFLPEDRQVTS